MPLVFVALVPLLVWLHRVAPGPATPATASVRNVDITGGVRVVGETCEIRRAVRRVDERCENACR